MIRVQYFKHEDGLTWSAVAPGQFEETITLWGNKSLGRANIDLDVQSQANTSYYERPNSNYEPCSREEYLTARGNAQAAIARFLVSFLPVQAPPATVTLCIGEVIENDLVS